MARTARETWTFRVELPADVANGGRFVARLLKHLLRAWGVRCTAVLDEAAVGTHRIAQDASAGDEAGQSSSTTTGVP